MSRSSVNAALSVTVADVVAAGGTAPPWWHVWRVDPVVLLTVTVRCVGLVAGLAGSVLTARYLQPAGRGEYFMALTAAQLLAYFGNLGLQSGNTYFVARDKGLFSGLLANSIWISFVGVPLLGIVVLGLSVWGDAGSTSAWFALALGPLFVFNFLGSGLLIGLQQMKTYSVTQILSTGIVLPFLLVAAALDAGPAGFLAASAVAWSIAGVVMVVLLLKQSSGSMGFRPDVFVTTFRYSTKVYLATLAGFLVLRINVFVLGAIAGAEEVGYYSIASQGADALAILPQSIATVLFPQLVADRTGRLAATVRAAARAAALLTVACAVVWTAAEPLIRLAFGAAFLPAVPVLQAMLPSVFLLGVLSVVSQYLAASGFPISVVACWIASVVLGTILSVVLIDLHGAVGAGEALSLTYAALLAALLVLCWRTAAAADRQPRPNLA